MHSHGDDVEDEERSWEGKDEHSYNSLSLFYGLFITMTGFACSLAPWMTTTIADLRIFIAHFVFEVYIYLASSLWLAFMFRRILNNTTSSVSFARRRFGRIEHMRSASTISNDYSMNLESSQRSINGFANGAFDNIESLQTEFQSGRTDESPPIEALASSPIEGEQEQEQHQEQEQVEEAEEAGDGEETRDGEDDQSGVQNADSDVVEIRKSVTIRSPESVIDLSSSSRMKRSASTTPTHHSYGRSNSTGLSRDDSARPTRLTISHSGAIHLASGESVSPSFYLRIGNIAFGIGAITNMVFFIISRIDNPIYCGNESEVWRGIAEALLGIVKIYFLFAQAFFIFKHSKAAIVRYQMFARFGQMHLAATNICLWFDTVVEEAVHSAYTSSSSSSSSTDTYTTTGSQSESEAYSNESLRFAAEVGLRAGAAECESPFTAVYNSLMTYFSPLTIEYSLIGAVSSYIIYQNIGFASTISRSSITETMRKVSRTRFSVDCSNSIRGLFAGIVMIILSMVTLIVVIANLSDILVFYFSATNAMCIAALVGCYMAHRDIAKLSVKPDDHRHERTTPDAILLMVSLSGVLLYSIFLLISTFGQDDPALFVLELIWSIATPVQSVYQVFLVFFSETRQCKTREEQKLKPGRGAVLFLLLANFGLWIDFSFISRSVIISSTTIPLFSTDAYQIIVSITLPLLIFFRFHSTACLSEVWRHVYASPKKRH